MKKCRRALKRYTRTLRACTDAACRTRIQQRARSSIIRACKGSRRGGKRRRNSSSRRRGGKRNKVRCRAAIIKYRRARSRCGENETCRWRVLRRSKKAIVRACIRQSKSNRKSRKCKRAAKYFRRRFRECGVNAKCRRRINLRSKRVLDRLCRGGVRGRGKGRGSGGKRKSMRCRKAMQRLRDHLRQCRNGSCRRRVQRRARRQLKRACLQGKGGNRRCSIAVRRLRRRLRACQTTSCRQRVRTHARLRLRKACLGANKKNRRGGSRRRTRTRRGKRSRRNGKLNFCQKEIIRFRKNLLKCRSRQCRGALLQEEKRVLSSVCTNQCLRFVNSYRRRVGQCRKYARNPRACERRLRQSGTGKFRRLCGTKPRGRKLNSCERHLLQYRRNRRQCGADKACHQRVTDRARVQMARECSPQCVQFVQNYRQKSRACGKNKACHKRLSKHHRRRFYLACGGKRVRTRGSRQIIQALRSHAFHKRCRAFVRKFLQGRTRCKGNNKCLADTTAASRPTFYRICHFGLKSDGRGSSRNGNGSKSRSRNGSKSRCRRFLKTFLSAQKQCLGNTKCLSALSRRTRGGFVRSCSVSTALVDNSRSAQAKRLRASYESEISAIKRGIKEFNVKASRRLPNGLEPTVTATAGALSSSSSSSFSASMAAAKQMAKLNRVIATTTPMSKCRLMRQQQRNTIPAKRHGLRCNRKGKLVKRYVMKNVLVKRPDGPRVFKRVKQLHRWREMRRYRVCKKNQKGKKKCQWKKYWKPRSGYRYVGKWVQQYKLVMTPKRVAKWTVSKARVRCRRGRRRAYVKVTRVRYVRAC